MERTMFGPISKRSVIFFLIRVVDRLMEFLSDLNFTIPSSY